MAFDGGKKTGQRNSDCVIAGGKPFAGEHAARIRQKLSERRRMSALAEEQDGRAHLWRSGKVEHDAGESTGRTRRRRRSQCRRRREKTHQDSGAQTPKASGQESQRLHDVLPPWRSVCRGLDLWRGFHRELRRLRDLLVVELI